MLKQKGKGSLDGPFRSQSAHDQNVLPRCARLGTNPGHPREGDKNKLGKMGRESSRASFLLAERAR
jgi:hypothetical protein